MLSPFGFCLNALGWNNHLKIHSLEKLYAFMKVVLNPSTTKKWSVTTHAIAPGTRPFCRVSSSASHGGTSLLALQMVTISSSDALALSRKDLVLAAFLSPTAFSRPPSMMITSAPAP